MDCITAALDTASHRSNAVVRHSAARASNTSRWINVTVSHHAPTGLAQEIDVTRHCRSQRAGSRPPTHPLYRPIVRCRFGKSVNAISPRSHWTNTHKRASLISTSGATEVVPEERNVNFVQMFPSTLDADAEEANYNSLLYIINI